MINCFKNEKAKLPLLYQILLSIKQIVSYFRMSYPKSQRTITNKKIQNLNIEHVVIS